MNMASKKTTELIELLGHPMLRQAAFEHVWMVLWQVPTDIVEKIPALPKKIFLNRIMAKPLEATLRALIAEGFHTEITSYDGCFNVRYIRGTEKTTRSLSRHSWGLAIDFNAATNPLGGPVLFSEKFLRVWRSNGWTCGADFRRLDGMHFEWNDFSEADVQEFLKG
jgi:hypothetical protein